MLTLIRAHWSKISTGLLLAILLGAGGMKVCERFAGDCCQPGGVLLPSWRFVLQGSSDSEGGAAVAARRRPRRDEAAAKLRTDGCAPAGPSSVRRVPPPVAHTPRRAHPGEPTHHIRRLRRCPPSASACTAPGDDTFHPPRLRAHSAHALPTRLVAAAHRLRPSGRLRNCADFPPALVACAAAAVAQSPIGSVAA
jgi:hypothetical protein